MANQKSPPLYILLVEVFYLLVLFAIGFIYITNPKLLPFIPDTLGSLPIGVPWYGALGAVIISLSGIVDHRKDWDSDFLFWHFTRPLVGAALAIISVLIFQAGILAVGSSPSSKSGTVPQNLLYYLIAFVVGYREEVFRNLIKRVADVILTPGGSASPPVTRTLNPTRGTVAGGDTVIITGSGFTDTTSVTFGSTPAATYHVDSDAQITATTPPGAGTVNVTVTTRTSSFTIGEFTYVAAPTVTGINPTSGLTNGGTRVTITGTSFTGATAVNFGTTAASSFNVNSDTQITAVSPASGTSESVDVTVVTPVGTSTTGAADHFTYT